MLVLENKDLNNDQVLQLDKGLAWQMTMAS